MTAADYWICSVCGKGVSRQPQHKDLRVRVANGWDHTRCHTQDTATTVEIEVLGTTTAPLTKAEAETLTKQIRVRVTHVWQLISEAYNRHAWTALGYDSWDSYTEAEFGDLRLRLPREERQEVVFSLRESGLSIRAIAAATQTSVNTVQKDLADVYQTDTPEPDLNPTYTSDLQPPPGAPTAATPGLTPRVREILDRQRQPATEPEKITGTDGKKYRKRKPKPKPKPEPTIPAPIELDAEAEAALANLIAGIDTIAERQAVVLAAVKNAADALVGTQRFAELVRLEKMTARCRNGWAELNLDVQRALGTMLKETR